MPVWRLTMDIAVPMPKGAPKGVIGQCHVSTRKQARDIESKFKELYSGDVWYSAIHKVEDKACAGEAAS